MDELICTRACRAQGAEAWTERGLLWGILKAAGWTEIELLWGILKAAGWTERGGRFRGAPPFMCKGHGRSLDRKKAVEKRQPQSSSLDRQRAAVGQSRGRWLDLRGSHSELSKPHRRSRGHWLDRNGGLLWDGVTAAGWTESRCRATTG
jgi:hypothetical protein